MGRRSRRARVLTKKVTVFCEGKTEARYVGGLRRWLASNHPEVRLSVECVDVGGGGYAEFAKRLKLEPDSNCVARVVLLDYDRCLSLPGEEAAFRKLVEASEESKKRIVPLILVVSNESFEYALCCHDPDYGDGNPSGFLIGHWGYSDSDDVKSDEGVWNKAHSGARGHGVAVSRLEGRSQVMNYDLTWKKNEQRIELRAVDYEPDNSTSRCSNLSDMFKVLGVV